MDRVKLPGQSLRKEISDLDTEGLFERDVGASGGVRRPLGENNTSIGGQFIITGKQVNLSSIS